eukprot:tig00020556_g10988.t1
MAKGDYLASMFEGAQTTRTRGGGAHGSSAHGVGPGHDKESGGKWRHIESEYLFPVLYALTEKPANQSSASRLLGPVLLIPDFFQLVALNFALDGPTWSPKFIVNWINDLGNFYDGILADSATIFAILFWGSVVLVIIALLDTFTVVILFKRRMYNIIFPVKMLRVLVATLVVGFYLPITQYLLFGVDCIMNADSPNMVKILAGSTCMENHFLIMAALSTALLVLFVPFCCTMSLLTVDIDLKSRDYLGAPHGRVEFLYTVARTVLVLLVRLVSAKSAVLVPVALAISSGLLTVCYGVFLPHYDHRVNKARAGLMAVSTGFAISTVILNGVGGSDSVSDGAHDAISMALLAASVLAFFPGYLLARWRVRRLEALRRKMEAAINSSADCEDRFSAYKQFKDPFIIETDLEVSTRFMRKSGNPDEDLPVAESLVRAGVAQFPTSQIARIGFYNFLDVFKEDHAAALGELKKAVLMKSRFDTRFMLFAINMRRQQTVAGMGQLNLVAMLELARDYKEAVRQHNEAIKLLRDFWKWTIKTRLRDADTAGKKLDVIDKAKQKAQLAYSKLVTEFPSSTVLIRQYATFLRDVMNDRASADLQFSKADDIEQSMEKEGTVIDGETEKDSDLNSRMGKSEKDEPEGEEADKRERLQQVLKSRMRDSRAVKTLSYAIILGTLLLLAETIAFFATVQTLVGQSSEGLTHLSVASARRKLVEDAMYSARSMQLALHLNDTAAYAEAAGALQKASTDLLDHHKHLFYDSGAYPWAEQYWQTMKWAVIKLQDERNFLAEKVEHNAWDSVAQFASRGQRLAKVSYESGALRDGTYSSDFRFLMDNGLFSVLSLLNTNTMRYETAIYEATVLRQGLVIMIFVVEMVTLALLSVFALRPDIAFRRQKSANQGVGDLLQKMPTKVLRSLLQVYLKLSRVEENIEGVLYGSGGGHGAAKGGDDEEEARSDEVENGEEGIPLAARGDDGRGIMSGDLEPPKASTAEWAVTGRRKSLNAEAPVKFDGDIVRPLSPADTSDEKRPRASPTAAAAAAERERRASKGGVQFNEIPGQAPPESKDLGGVPKKKEEAPVVSEQLMRDLRTFIFAKLADEVPPEFMGLETIAEEAEAAPAAASAEGAPGGGEGERAAAATERRGSAELVKSVADRFKEQAMAKYAAAQGREETDEAEDGADKKGGKGGRVAPEVSSASFRKSKNRTWKLTKHLLYRNATAFALLAALACANLAFSHSYLGVSRVLGSQAQAAGRRHYATRELALLARELVIADGTGMSRGEVALRLLQGVEYVRALHERLRFGFGGWSLPAAPLRYRPMMDLLDKPACLLADASRCSAPGRVVDPEAVMQGFNMLVDTYLDRLTAIYLRHHASLPDFAPPSPAQEANPCLSLERLDFCGYEQQPNRLPAAKGFSRPTWRQAGGRYDLRATLASTPELLFVQQVSNADVNDASERAIALYLAEFADALKIVGNGEAGFLIANLAAILGTAFFLFKPMLEMLKKEANRVRQFLLMVPSEIVLRERCFKSFLSLEEKAGDGSESD